MFAVADKDYASKSEIFEIKDKSKIKVKINQFEASEIVENSLKEILKNSKKVLGKIHKFFGFWYPGIVYYDEMKKVCDFLLTKRTQCAIIYNVRRGNDPKQKNKKSFKNPLTSSTKCDIMYMSIRERHKTSPTDKKNKKSFDKPLDKRHKMCYNIRAVGKKPTD